MAKVLTRRDDLVCEYTGALRHYLRHAGEAGLQTAYELGRRGLGEGRGVLNMVDLHHQAMIAVLAERDPSRPLTSGAVERAGTFFAESMSAYEMTHRAVREANEALRHMNQALEDEVKGIARALHDEAGQLLAAVYLALDQLAREVHPSGKDQLRDVKDLLGEVDSQLRRLAHELRPTLLDDLGLAPAIEFLSEGVSKRSGVRISLQATKGKRLPAPLETILYRVVQEALNNVSKHARATSVKIRLQTSGKAIRCSIIDDGIGFDPKGSTPSAQERGFGLLGMREKLQPLGGEVRIESAPGQGTKILITIPREV
jgi:signal transduction histidine kinase